MGNNSYFSMVFLVVSAMFMVMLLVPAKADDEKLMKETKMTVYFQDFSSGGPNSTALPMVGFPGKVWSFTDFGTLAVTDDLLTEGPDLRSPTVGRGQGISITASLDGRRAHVSISIVFTNEAYNGSTIQIQGNSDQLDVVREYAVVSGTGVFRYARGYVTLQTIFFEQSTSYAIIRCDITVRHY